MITVHIGLHKTGSSSIQFALSQLRPKPTLPIVVPRTGQGSSDEALHDALLRLRSAGNGVISDENFIGHPFDGYSALEHRMAMLRESLMGVPMQVIVYLRPQHSWLASVFTQRVQQGGTADAYEFWQGMRAFANLDWTILVERLREAVGADRIIALAYTGGDVVTDFFARAGLPRPNTDQPIRENISIASVQIPLLAAVNGHLGKGPQQTRARACFQTVLGPGARRDLSVFPEDLQEEISQRYRSRWRALCDIALPDDRPAFERGLREWPAEPVPSAGTSLEDDAIQAEAIRALAVLTGMSAGRGPRPWHRAVQWVRRDPVGIPRRAWHRIRRGS